MFKENKNGLKVLTPDGYKSFRGIQKIIKPSVEVTFQCGKKIKCSKNHPLCVDLYNFKFEKAKNLKKGIKIFGHSDWYIVDLITDIGEIELYDLIDVEDTVCYYTNGLLSHNCEFINSGTSSLSEDLYRELLKHIQPPVEVLMDGKYKIFEKPNPEKIYVAGVDVSEGVGGDYSVIKILDITDLREIIEVAEYYDNTIPVAEFSNKLYEILQHWGNPLVCIERNNQGGQVVDRLAHDFGYPRVVSWGAKQAGRKSVNLLGMISSRTTKYNACMNARYYYNDAKAVIFRNADSLEELFKDFVKINDTWGASSGKHDDRTMALIWALKVLDNDLCSEWFTIEEVDTCGKVRTIAPLDLGIKYFEGQTSIYTNEAIANIEHSMLNPIAFGAFGQADDEISSLMSQGWQFIGGSSPYIDPSRNISPEQFETLDKWFD